MRSGKRSASDVELDAEAALPPPAALNAEQRRGWDLVMRQGRSVFITGRAGCGKSFLVQRLIAALREQLGERAVYVTAATGIAACNIGGITLHSFAGIGLGTDDVLALTRKIKRNTRVMSRWQRAKVLVVDEISMVDADLLDKLDAIARRIRGAPDKVWGGLRVILVGDFFQLPPVARADQAPKRFAFDAACWEQLFGVDMACIVDLRTQMRQRDDMTFTTLLNGLRVGHVPAHAAEVLAKAGGGLAALERAGLRATKLFPHNAKVDSINQAALQALSGDIEVLVANDTGTKAGKAQLARHCRVPSTIELKVGAQVMLLRNVAPFLGLVNGVQGVVEAFVWATDAHTVKLPRVRFRTQNHGEQVRVLNPTKWELKVGRTVIAKRVQVPLRLSYAITIHKSQGMTIDALEVDLDGVFAPGQAYVALSRAVSLDRVRVRNFRASAIRFNADVLRFYVRIAQHQPPKSKCVDAQPDGEAVVDTDTRAAKRARLRAVHGPTNTSGETPPGAAEPIVRATTQVHAAQLQACRKVPSERGADNS